MNTFLPTLLITSLTTVLSLFSAGAFALTPGDILVVDRDVDLEVETEGQGALFRVDPVTGDREILSDFGEGANRGFTPLDAAVEADGHILVLDAQAGTEGQGALFRVNPVSGARTVLSDFGSGVNQGRLPLDLAVEADGHILVVGLPAGTEGPGALFRVNPITGSRDLLSDFGDDADPGSSLRVSDVAVEADGGILVTTEDIELQTTAEDPERAIQAPSSRWTRSPVHAPCSPTSGAA